MDRLCLSAHTMSEWLSAMNRLAVLATAHTDTQSCYWTAPSSRVLLKKLILTLLFKKVFTFYGTGMFIIAFTRARSPDGSTILHALPSYSFIHFNIIFPSTPMSSKWFLFFSRFRTKPCMHFLFPYTCYNSQPSHPPWFGHINKIWRVV